MRLETVGWVANSVDPDQTPQNAASDVGLHCFLRYIYEEMVNTILFLVKYVTSTTNTCSILESIIPYLP